MPTDITDFKQQYRTARLAEGLPLEVGLQFTMLDNKDGSVRLKRKTFTDPDTGEEVGVRYGTNPHQPCALYVTEGGIFDTMEFLKMGKGGPSLTNLQDMNQALQILKCIGQPAVAVMKHLNPSGVAADICNCRQLVSVYEDARDADARSAFGSVVGFNREVDNYTAEAIMKTFVEAVIAPRYSDKAISILRGGRKQNRDIRVVKLNRSIDEIPKYEGDLDERPEFWLRSMADGSIALEAPYLTRITGINQIGTQPYVRKPEGGVVEARVLPVEAQLWDMLFAWYVNIGVRSNGIVIAKDGVTLAVGTGQQERIGAVEQAIYKARQKAIAREEDPDICLKGSVMSSDAFFPSRDCIDAAADAGIKAIIYPAGSKEDAEIIKAANERGIALGVTGERCFSHH